MGDGCRQLAVAATYSSGETEKPNRVNKQDSHGVTRAAVGGTPMTQQHLAVVVVDRYRSLVAVAVQAVVAGGQN